MSEGGAAEGGMDAALLGLTTPDAPFLICDKDPSLFITEGISFLNGGCAEEGLEGVFWEVLIWGIESSRLIWGMDDSRLMFGVDTSRLNTGSWDLVKEFSRDTAPGVGIPVELLPSLDAVDCPLGTTFVDLDFGVGRPLILLMEPCTEPCEEKALLDNVDKIKLESKVCPKILW